MMSVAVSTDQQAALPLAADLSTRACPVGVWIMALPIVDRRQRTRGPSLLVLAPAKNKRHPWTHPLTHQYCDCSLFDSGVHPIPI